MIFRDCCCGETGGENGDDPEAVSLKKKFSVSAIAVVRHISKLIL